MDAEQAIWLRQLISTQQIAALGTLREGEPFVSMVPYAIEPGSGSFLIHVSRLAAHTRAMLASPRVSLLVVATEGAAPQSRARVTLQGDAAPLERDSPAHAAARACYTARFPEAAHIFELGDFSIFRITSVSARVVGGFGQAFSIGAESFARAMQES